jgi:hypothetical protein
LPPALAVLEKYSHWKEPSQHGMLFPRVTNQEMNRSLDMGLLQSKLDDGGRNNLTIFKKQQQTNYIWIASHLLKVAFLWPDQLFIMIAKFQVEFVHTAKKEVHVFCKYLTMDINYHISENSYLGELPVRWLHPPRANDKDGNPRYDLCMFALKNADDKEKIKVNDVYEMWDDYVDVIASFKLSIGKMLAFLKCYPGKYEEEYILEDSSKKQWILKKYLFVTGSVETYEKTRKEESENIFQYLIQPVGHEEKPTVGTRLRIYRKK